MLTILLPVFAVHLVAAISPGPAVLMTTRLSMLNGLRSGAAFSVGVALGALVWAGAALLGMAALFDIAPRLLTGFKLLGAAYLLWVALRMWRNAPAPLDLASSSLHPRTAPRLVLLGIATQLANPKPAIFFGAIFVTLVPGDADPMTLAAVLAIVFVNEAGWNILLARLFSLETTRAGYLRLKTVIDRSLGGLLACLGLKIALS